MPESFLLFNSVAYPLGIVSASYRWLPRRLKEEIWWAVTRFFYPMMITAITIDAIFNHDVGAWVSRICLPFWIIMWVQDYKDDHDDRWKKRRKKLLARIKILGRKLVVVPTN